MSRRRPRSSLALRTYAFAASIAIAVTVALLVLPRYLGGARYLEPQAALVQNVVDRMSQRDPERRDEVMARLAERLRGKLTLFDAQLAELRSTAETLSRPTAHELETLRQDKWSLAFGRIVVRSDDASMIGVYLPNRPSFPWHFVLPLGLAVLVVVGAASLWFSHRLARPLGELAAAARRFGGGDTSARARLHRDDELGEVGRAFDDMAGRTEAVLISQRQLMADVSHELRTPLARIRVALELASEDPIAARDVLADVGSDLDEMDQLIGDILTTARLDHNPVELRRERIVVGELADRARSGFAARHPERVLHHHCQDEVSRATVEGDPMLLRRALDNLLDNAANYSDAATPITLTLAICGADARSIGFEVIDHGIGMTAADLDRAFTPFWRADASRARRSGGVGLGLALARRIARAHRGEVTLVSTPGCGTTARLEILTAGGQL
jgi:two-component system, OmpR family, sensor kinase